MFTGLVEEVGRIRTVVRGAKSAAIAIEAQKVLVGLQIGDSISTNGVCLTVTDFDGKGFTVDVMAETMKRSNLRHLASGDRVNLERALRLGDRLGGHLVSGHIDGTGVITSMEKEDNAVWLTVAANPELLKYIVFKGSIAINGVSLTVAYADMQTFKVSIIPHTKEVTTLLEGRTGDEVNLECDMIGKYVERLLFFREMTPQKQDISMEFLSRHGFA